MQSLREAWYTIVMISRALFWRGHFDVSQIPDLSGRVVIVTGGNVGIGREIIKVLLQRNAKVYMASRSRVKAEEAIGLLKEETGKSAMFLDLDLSNLSSVRKAASQFLAQEQELHILFNNAGVMLAPTDMVTADGYDLTFGTNVIGHFLFTQLMMPAIMAGKETSPDHHSRIITTSGSIALRGHIQFDTFKDGLARRRLSPTDLYAQSKLANMIIANQLARRYADRGIVSISVDPGSIESDLQRHAKKIFTGSRAFLVDIVNSIILRPTPLGSLTPLFAATMPEALHHNGKMLVPIARVGKIYRPEAYDDRLGRQLWDRLEQEVQGH